MKKSTKCICPKCGKKHKMRLYWVGDHMPRKFCVPCTKGMAYPIKAKAHIPTMALGDIINESHDY